MSSSNCDLDVMVTTGILAVVLYLVRGEVGECWELKSLVLDVMDVLLRWGRGGGNIAVRSVASRVELFFSKCFWRVGCECWLKGNYKKRYMMVDVQ